MGSIRKSKTKRRTRDLDQIFPDYVDPNRRQQNEESQPIDDTKPGLGQFLCTACNKYFDTDQARVHHLKGKNHKRRVRMLQDNPYSTQEAAAAGGIGTAEFYTQFKVAQKEAKERLQKERAVRKAAKRAAIKTKVRISGPDAQVPASSLDKISIDEEMVIAN